MRIFYIRYKENVCNLTGDVERRLRCRPELMCLYQTEQSSKILGKSFEGHF